ncbi:hypothetical protein BJX63DRAFT_415775, partial [Aspergillus granulosus]
MGSDRGGIEVAESRSQMRGANTRGGGRKSEATCHPPPAQDTHDTRRQVNNGGMEWRRGNVKRGSV